ncbi:unnamed protein product [Symbiodinium sp. CCMP2592]|nr:unnamed protein product [Symbiodinium sp. CCMP2592]
MECGEACQVEILNAATMLPPMFSCAAACWLVGPKAWWRSHAAIALLSGWFLMVPASTASHLYCAFNGQYLPKLERLDQACISIASVLAAWALSRSNLFTAFVGSICISLDLLMFAGPEELHHHVAWRTETLSCVVLLYLSPMVWRRNTFDFSIIPICLCFLFGLAMAVPLRSSGKGVQGSFIWRRDASRSLPGLALTNRAGSWAWVFHDGQVTGSML